MDTSIFMDKAHAPEDNDLKKALDKKYELWNELKEYVFNNSPVANEEWNYSKFGWNYRIKDKKRAVLYLMPCDRFFKASLVLGKKAVVEALGSNISEDIKNIISSAKVYAEGAGIRIDVKNKKTVADIKKLIDIKIAN